MIKNNKSRVMLITGTRKGLGNFLVEYYCKNNFKVIGCSRGNIDRDFDNYQHYCLDVTDEKAVKRMMSEIRKIYGRLDILINNAGVNLAHAPIALVTYKSALETVKVNLLGTFLVTREAIKIMMRQNFGRIVNLSSMLVKHEVIGSAIYTASKAAINSLTRVIAKEVGLNNITCNAIAPSAIKTDLTDSLDNELLQQILNQNAIPKFGNIEDLCNTIDWLIKPESNSITGQIIYLGGA